MEPQDRGGMRPCWATHCRYRKRLGVDERRIRKLAIGNYARVLKVALQPGRR